MKKSFLAVALLTVLTAGASRAADPGGAAALTLAPDCSFTDDSSSNYPIRGKNLG